MNEVQTSREGVGGSVGTGSGTGSGVSEMSVSSSRKSHTHTTCIPTQVTSPRRVLLKLFAHTVAMFTLPFIAYYGSKDYVEREYGMEPPKSFIYGAIAAVIVVQGVIFSYIYQAFQEEQLEKRAAAAAAKRD